MGNEIPIQGAEQCEYGSNLEHLIEPMHQMISKWSQIKTRRSGGACPDFQSVIQTNLL
jgi:hypothetical protein